MVSQAPGSVHVDLGGGGSTNSSTSWYCGIRCGILSPSSIYRFAKKNRWTGGRRFSVIFSFLKRRRSSLLHESNKQGNCTNIVWKKNPGGNGMNTDWSNKCGVRSLVVVPKTHKAPLKEPENARGVNWDVCRDDEGLAATAVLVDPRPRDRQNCLATLVLWNSRTVHCNGHFGRGQKRGRSTKNAYSPTVTQDGHFAARDDAWLAFLEENGFAPRSPRRFRGRSWRRERRHVLLPRRARDFPGKGEERELAPPGPDVEPVLSKERGFVVGARVPVPEATRRLPAISTDGGLASPSPVDGRRAPNDG